MIIGSVTYPCFIEIEGETPEDPNLEYMDIPALKKKYREEREKYTLGERLLRGATEEVVRCNHNWGMIHFWRNPMMLPPCLVTKIDGKWYKRKSCDHIDLTDIAE